MDQPRRRGAAELRLPTQAAPIVRDGGSPTGGRGRAGGVAAAAMSLGPLAPLLGTTTFGPPIGTPPCEQLTGLARQMCFALKYGINV
jgi:hypothetical protein